MPEFPGLPCVEPRNEALSLLVHPGISQDELGLRADRSFILWPYTDIRRRR